MRGKFITIEGCEGAGKSTQIRLMKEYFANKDFLVYFTREPGGTIISEAIRNIILDPINTEMDPITELMLYAASRRQLTVQIIKEKLESGITVICDRYIDSTTAYQGFGRGLDLEIIYNLNKWALAGIDIDLTIFLDVPPEEGFDRKKNPKGYDRLELERDTFHKRVYDGYKWLLEKAPDRIVRVDGKKPKKIVFRDIIELFDKRGVFNN